MPAGYNAIVFPGSTYLPEVEENPGGEEENSNKEGTAFKKLSEVIRKLSRQATGKRLLLGNGSDFTRPQLTVPGLIKEWNRRYPDKKIKFSLVSEVFQAWEEESKDIPTIPADFNPAFQGTYCTRIGLKQQNRLLENYLEIAEKISACTPEGR